MSHFVPLILALVALSIAATLTLTAGAPPADDFVKSLDDKAKEVLKSEVLGELASKLYERVNVKEGKIVHDIDAKKVGFAVHAVVMSWKGVLNGVFTFKSKDKRVVEIKERQRGECQNVAATLAPVMSDLPAISLKDPKQLTEEGKKLVAVARVCEVLMDKAGDQIYAKESARARL